MRAQRRCDGRAPRLRASAFFAAIAAAVAAMGAAPAAARASDAQRDAMRAQGQNVYGTHCVGCHGVAGDGKGPAAEMLIVKPRDFTKGLFKFRSTPNGTLPTDEDLYRTITRGVNRTSMPEWSLLPDRERFAVVEYVKSFYPEWDQRGAGAPIYIPSPPATLLTPESIARGRELYEMLECGRCHGPQGQGDGPSAKTLEPDAWGNHQVPFNFTKGALKSGAAPQDVYRTFMTGLNGTAMPSFADVFDQPDGESIHPGDAWNLVSYILSLRQSGARTAAAPAAKEQAP
ncbi:MAG TPA: cytochrome c [Candidatus Binatia bacterium]|nr:cytochrome c [Candidatus Binatia bacterium]